MAFASVLMVRLESPHKHGEISLFNQVERRRQVGAVAMARDMHLHIADPPLNSPEKP